MLDDLYGRYYTTVRRGGVGCSRSDVNVGADTDEEGESRQGYNVGEDKELIRRGGDDTAYAAGGRGGGGAEGKYGGPEKAPAEDRGGTPEGQGEGQLPRAFGGRSRPSIFLDYARYANRGGGTGADLRAEIRRTALNPVERPPHRPSPQLLPPYPRCPGTS